MAVTVITATHNRPDLLRRAIASVNAQTWRDLEHIVIADGPENQWPHNVRFVQLGRNWRSFRGVQSRGADPRMVGCMLAQGEYIAYLDDDNEWAPNHLELAIAALERTGADFVTTQALSLPQNVVIGDGELRVGQVDTSTLVHRAACLLKGNWQAIDPPEDDWDLMYRWSAEGLKWAFVPNVTVTLHVGASS
jgi:glycosyltransferase involved in cell wall biosynthesis